MTPAPIAPQPARLSLMKPSVPVELALQADYFEGQIDTRAFRSRHPNYSVISSNPLVLEPEVGSWIYVERFGAVVFWNCSEAHVQTFLRDLQELPGTGPRIGSTHDSQTVHVGSEEDTVGFSAVWQSVKKVSNASWNFLFFLWASSIFLRSPAARSGASRHGSSRSIPPAISSRRGRAHPSYRSARPSTESRYSTDR